MPIRDYSGFLSEFPSAEIGDIKIQHKLTESHGLSRRTIVWLFTAIENCLAKDCSRFDLGIPEVDTKATQQLKTISKVLQLAWPNFDPDMPGYIVMWANEKGRMKGRSGRVNMKAGRAFRKMFPCLTDAEIERLVDEFRAKFAIKNLTIKQGQMPSDFNFAFSGRMAEFENPYTTSSRKFLGNSCMRHSFDHLDHHPAEAYASGDFTVFYCLDSEERVAGRCVVLTATETWQAAPIYGVSEQAISKLEEHIKKLNPDCVFELHKINWDGAKMLFLSSDEKAAILPYVDTEEKRLTLDDGGYLVFDEAGEYKADTINGVVYPDDSKCCSVCDEYVGEDYSVYHNGEYYCEECFHENHIHCEHCEEYEPINDSVTVNVVRRWGHSEETWCDNCAVNDSQIVRGVCSDYERWADSDVITTYNGEVISPALAECDYFVSGWDGECYPVDMLAELEGDGLVSITEIESDLVNNNWVQNSYGIWFIAKDEETENDREIETEETTDA